MFSEFFAVTMMDHMTLFLRRLNVAVFLCVILFAGVAVVCFLRWMTQSDLIGHNYRPGPPKWLFYAMASAVAAVIMSLTWFATLVLLLRKKRRSERSSDQSLSSLAISIGLIALLDLVALGIMAMSSSALPESRRQEMLTRAESISEMAPSDMTGSEAQELIVGMQSDDELVRYLSAVALERIGADARPAIPVLIDAVKKKQVGTSSEAAEALGNIGSEDAAVVSALVEALDGDLVLKLAAIDALVKIGPSGRQALMNRLKSADSAQRLLVLEALTHFSDDAKDLEAPIRLFLADPDPKNRIAAIQSLGRFSRNIPTFIEPLCEQLDDVDSNVKLAAMEAIGRLGWKANAAVPWLKKLLDDQDSTVSETALLTLAKVSPQSLFAVQVLIMELAKPDTRAQSHAAQRLAYMGPKAIDALPALLPLLESEDLQVRLNTAKAVWRIGGDADLVVPVLIEVYESADSSPTHAFSLRYGAATTLGEMGRAASAAIPMLREAQNEDKQGANDARMALVKIDVPDENLLSTHLERLKDQSKTTQRKAVARIGQFGAKAVDAVPDLIECLGDEDLFLRLDAARSLGNIGPPAADALPALRVLLREGGDSRKATDAGRAILAIVDNSIPDLIECLGEEDLSLKTKAAQKLRDIGPPAKDALPALREMQNEVGAWQIKSSATKAIEAIAIDPSEAR